MEYDRRVPLLVPWVEIEEVCAHVSCVRATRSLEQAGIAPEEVNYVNAHATSTQARPPSIQCKPYSHSLIWSFYICDLAMLEDSICVVPLLCAAALNACCFNLAIEADQNYFFL